MAIDTDSLIKKAWEYFSSSFTSHINDLVSKISGLLGFAKDLKIDFGTSGTDIPKDIQQYSAQATQALQNFVLPTANPNIGHATDVAENSAPPAGSKKTNAPVVGA